jgi:hypothetical protein
MTINMHFTGLHNGWRQHLRVYIVYVSTKIKAGNVFVYTRGQRTRTKRKRELETEIFLVFYSFLLSCSL